MNIFKRNWFIIILLLPFLYISIQCGNSIGVLPSEEYRTWKADILLSYPDIDKFAENSELILREWQEWKWTSEDFQEWENASAERVWKSKKYNCYLLNLLLQGLYPRGEIVIREQPGDFRHSVYFYNGKIYSFTGTKCEVFNSWEEYPYYKKEKKL